MTPRRAIVPTSPTHEMKAAGAQGFGPGEGGYDIAHDIYARMIAASPNAGRLGAADLERAAEAAWEKFREQVAELGGQSIEPWADTIPACKRRWIDRQRAAFEAIGLPVENQGN